MKLLIDIGHPAHVHFFKNIISNLLHKGHEVKIVMRAREITKHLLEKYNLDYEYLSKNYRGLTRKAIGMFRIDYRLYKIAKSFDPDILMGIGSLYSAHVSKLLRKASIVFTDTEHAVLINKLAFPFATTVLTPSCFHGRVSKKKHVRYKGYHELAYLHPNYFKPDSAVLEWLDLSKDERFFIIRFSSLDASHDIRKRGFDFRGKDEIKGFLRRLEEHGRPFLANEIELGKNFEKYSLRTPPEQIHSLLSYATLYIGEGATMASEAGVLGVPWIYASTKRLGYLDDQESRYGLGVTLDSSEKVFKKALELLENENLRNEWRMKRERMLENSVDVTRFVTEFIDGYPESFIRLIEKSE